MLPQLQCKVWRKTVLVVFARGFGYTGELLNQAKHFSLYKHRDPPSPCLIILRTVSLPKIFHTSCRHILGTVMSRIPFQVKIKTDNDSHLLITKNFRFITNTLGVYQPQLVIRVTTLHHALNEPCFTGQVSPYLP